MNATKETYLAAAAFAAKDGFETILYTGIYKDCIAYYATSDALAGTCSGYPHYVLVSSCEKGVTCRYAIPDEALEIINLKK